MREAVAATMTGAGSIRSQIIELMKDGVERSKGQIARALYAKYGRNRNSVETVCSDFAQHPDFTSRRVGHVVLYKYTG